MNNLIAGQNVEIRFPLIVEVTLASNPGYDIDPSVYLLKDGKITGDEDVIFFNAPTSKDGSVRLQSLGQKHTINIDKMPAGRDRIAITLASETAANKLTGAGAITVTDGSNVASLSSDLAAIIVAEVYERNGAYRLKIIGQGFDGGLGKLAAHYGADVDEPAPSQASAPAAAPAPTPAKINLSKVDLRKDKVINLAKGDSKIIDLTKKAAINLQKKGLANETAKFGLVLDISGSMQKLYLNGAVERLVQRALAIGMTLDDDLSIDLFPFGVNAYNYGSTGPSDYKNVVPQIIRNYGLEGGTYYGLAMEMVRNHYKSQPDWGDLPVYIMFVTDGGTQDVRRSETQIIEASREPIFWQFMAIGDMPKPKFGMTRNRNVLPRGFEFLQHLDNMSGRYVDNANFFAVDDPDSPTDEELYDLLMAEYPTWLREVRQKNMIR